MTRSIVPEAMPPRTALQAASHFPASLLACCFCLVACPAGTSGSRNATGTGDWTVFEQVDGRGRIENPKAGRDTDVADQVYIEDGRRYEVVSETDGAEWHRRMWLSPSAVPPGGHAPSFAFEACNSPETNGRCGREPLRKFPNIKDRVELAIINHATGDEAEQLKFGRTRYLSFQVMFNKNSQVPRGWTLVTQVVQLHEAGLAPPFAIWIRPRKLSMTQADRLPLELLFVTRNDTTDPRLPSVCEPTDRRSGCPTIVYSKVVEREDWHRFAIRLKPGDEGEGELAIWDGSDPVRDQPDVDWRGNWGYTPDAAARNDFTIRVGIYRRPQPRILKVMFDNIGYGPDPIPVE